MLAVFNEWATAHSVPTVDNLEGVHAYLGSNVEGNQKIDSVEYLVNAVTKLLEKGMGYIMLG